jgi:hypothetical protein
VNRVVGRNGSLQLRRSGVISVQRVLICARNIRFVKLSLRRMRVESRLLIADQREFDASSRSCSTAIRISLSNRHCGR